MVSAYFGGILTQLSVYSDDSLHIGGYNGLLLPNSLHTRRTYLLMTYIPYPFRSLRRGALIVTLGATLLVSLAACGTASDPAGSAPPPVAAVPTATLAA